jgi:hypothetical protein
MCVPISRRAAGVRAVLLVGCLLVAHAATAQRTWTPPETLTPATQTVRRPQLAIDGVGNALATWSRDDGTTRQAQAARMAATGSWTPGIDLYTPASPVPVPFDATDVALNAAGRGAAVWVRATGTRDQIVQAAVFDGAAWSAATSLMPAAVATVRSPRVDVDANGNVVAVWVQLLNGVTVVRAARWDMSGGWSAPVTVSAPTESVEDSVALGGDDAGNAVAVWTSAAGGVRALRAAQLTAISNSWSPAVDIATPGRLPSIVRLTVNRSGTAAFVAFRGFDGSHDVARVVPLDPANDGTVQTARFAGAWGSVTDRSTGVATGDVTLDTDAVGNGVLAWTEWDGAQYRVRASGYNVVSGIWTEAESVSETGEDAAVPRIRLQADGTATLVWQSTRDLPGIRASRWVPSTTPVLQPAVVQGTQITLAWRPGTGPLPTGYTVIASRTPGGPPVAGLSAGAQTSVVVTAQAGAYFVRVLATVSGAQVPSNEIVVIVGAGGAPTEPQTLAATVAGSTVTLTWAPPLNVSLAPVRTYYVEAGGASGVSDIAFFPTGNALVSYVTTAVPNGSYWVRVRAESAGGVGPASNEVRVIVGPPPPGAPVLSGGATGPGAVSLQWTAAPAPGASVTGYQLRAGYQPGQSNAAVIDLPASPLAYAASGIPPGTYYVRVVALSSAGPGAVSNEVVVTVTP